MSVLGKRPAAPAAAAAAAAAAVATPSPSLFSQVMAASAGAERHDQLRRYYAEAFPVDAVFRLLTHNGAYPAGRRELALVKQRVAEGAPLYLRWRSAESARHLRAQLLRELPDKLEIGAVYSRAIARRADDDNDGTDGTDNEDKIETETEGNTGACLPTRHELVFDIDVGDYERPCCADPKQTCARCWHFVACAVRVLEHVLAEHLGFEQRLWVFSGRRGAHCWVLDADANALHADTRALLCEYLSASAPLLRTDETVQRACQACFDAVYGAAPGTRQRALDACLPRIDRPVTCQPSHLLKSPFAAHPATDFICLVLTPDEMATFDPLRGAPTLRAIVDGEPDAVARLAQSLALFETILSTL